MELSKDKSQEISLEGKVFKRVCLISFLTNIIFTILSAFILEDGIVVGVNIVSTVLFSIFYYFSKYTKAVKFLSFPFILLIAFLANFTWLQADGYDGANPYFYLLVLVFSIIVLKGKLRFYFYVFVIANILVLFFIEHSVPVVANDYQGLGLLNQGITLVAVFALTAYLIHYLKRNYDAERVVIKLMNKELEDRNHEIESQIEKLLQQGEELYSTNEQLEDKNRMILQMNEQLKEYSESLEIRVAERTKELTLLNRDLLNKNAKLEQFAFIIAHNLRSPIAQLLGLNNLLPLDKISDDYVRHILANMQKSALRLDEVVSDLNYILSMKSNVQRNLEKVNLYEQIDLALAALKEEITSSNAEVDTHVSPEVNILGIKPYIQSVFYNIIHNAIKYSSQKSRPEIKISIIEEGKIIKVQVEDNGIGIEMKYAQGKLFKLYQKFNVKYPGKGMGLFLVKTQLEAMRGDISIESTYGEGTKVTVCFVGA